MRDHRPQSNVDLLDSLTGDIQTKASLLAKLNQEISKILPRAEKICRVANYRNGVLVLECASAAWSTRLNYDRQHLLSSLRKSQLPSLMTIEIKINPELAKAEIDQYRKIIPAKAPISQQSADYLLVLASCTSDKIAEKLKNIAKLANKKS